jgi:hypothetical protein
MRVHPPWDRAGAQSQPAFPSCRCNATACSATVARNRSISVWPRANAACRRLPGATGYRPGQLVQRPLLRPPRDVHRGPVHPEPVGGLPLSTARSAAKRRPRTSRSATTAAGTSSAQRDRTPSPTSCPIRRTEGTRPTAADGRRLVQKRRRRPDGVRRSTSLGAVLLAGLRIWVWRILGTDLVLRPRRAGGRASGGVAESMNPQAGVHPCPRRGSRRCTAGFHRCSGRKAMVRAASWSGRPGRGHGVDVDTLRTSGSGATDVWLFRCQWQFVVRQGVAGATPLCVRRWGVRC